MTKHGHHHQLTGICISQSQHTQWTWRGCGLVNVTFIPPLLILQKKNLRCHPPSPSFLRQQRKFRPFCSFLDEQSFHWVNQKRGVDEVMTLFRKRACPIVSSGLFGRKWGVKWCPRPTLVVIKPASCVDMATVWYASVLKCRAMDECRRRPWDMSFGILSLLMRVKWGLNEVFRFKPDSIFFHKIYIVGD